MLLVESHISILAIKKQTLERSLGPAAAMELKPSRSFFCSLLKVNEMIDGVTDHQSRS